VISTRHAWWLTAALFAVFLAYFNFTSNALPRGAGPDNEANNAAANFIYQHGRLAALPADEDRLEYTVYGSTRALRPPLSFAMAAGIARLFPPDWNKVVVTEEGLRATGGDYQKLADQQLQKRFRKASALLCALAVAATFLALYVFTASLLAGIAGAALLGLMPQFTFIASYTNDDSAAIFAGSLVILAVVLIYRYGLNAARSMFLGIAGGLVVVSKPTAWLLAPAVALGLLLFVRAPWREVLRQGVIAALFAFAFGGWWLAFNVAHYGVKDPFARKVQSVVGERHRQIPDESIQGFQAKHIGFYGLLVRNQENFWQRTVKSTVGKLDWLRLNVGPPQYTLYIALFLVGLAGFVARAPGGLLRLARGSPDGRAFALEGVMFVAVAFQLAMFTWRNITTEVQLQGKYLMPAMLPVLLLAFGTLHAWGRAIADRRHGAAFVVTPSSAAHAALAALTVGAVLVHVHALARYVVPFYWPYAYDLSLTPFRPVLLSARQVRPIGDMRDVRVVDNGIEFQSTGRDPSFEISDIVCRYPGNLLLRVDLEAEQAGAFQVFIDRGEGFNERHSQSTRYPAGRSEILMALDSSRCQRIRIDPGTTPGHYHLWAISYAQLYVRQPL